MPLGECGATQRSVGQLEFFLSIYSLQIYSQPFNLTFSYFLCSNWRFYFVFILWFAEEEGWSAEAFAELENETSDRLLSAQVVAYSLEGPPLIYMYQMTTNEEAVLVNRQLVTRGVAQWVEPQLIVN